MNHSLTRWVLPALIAGAATAVHAQQPAADT